MEKIENSNRHTHLSLPSVCNSVVSEFLGATLSFVARVAAPFRQGESTDPYKSKRRNGSALLDTPIYDPTSKNYFELIEIKGGAPYDRALRMARKKTYKGFRGRLAIIRSASTQQNIDRCLMPDREAWIGLRFSCTRRVLLWADGKLLRPDKDYVNWGPNWHYAKDHPPCYPGDKFAGVTLSPISQAGYAGEGLSWFVISSRHSVVYSIIEYPTNGQLRN
jgi:hypothetical protein